MDLFVGGKYRLGNRIGQGSFGDIYLGTHIETNLPVAIKLEKVRSSHPQLLYESRLIRSLQGGVGMPNIYWFGVEGDYNVMVIELLGSSLEELLQLCKPGFSIKTVLTIADQMISRIEYIHSKDYLHRDIKPDNFLISLEANPQIIYLIDYGLAKKFKDSKTGLHIHYREGKKIIGTARYASINTHLGIEQSRRDDLECLGYVLVYLIKGNLPWQGLFGKNKQEKYKNIFEKKINTSLNELCQGLPIEFINYFQYCRALSFEDRPDYTLIKRHFNELFKRCGFCMDHNFEWNHITKNEDKRKSRNPSPDKYEQTQPLKPKNILRHSEYDIKNIHPHLHSNSKSLDFHIIN